MKSTLFRRFLDRRRQGGPVETERRRPSMQDADEMLAQSIERMEKTSIRRRLPASANDVQRVVEFSTFAAICEYRYSNGNVVCKHELHEAHGQGIATCNEQQCPFARGKVK